MLDKIVFCRKSNRRTEGRVDGSEEGEGDKVGPVLCSSYTYDHASHFHLHFDQVGLLTSALMEEDLSLEQEA